MKKIFIILLAAVFFGNNSCNVSEAESLTVKAEIKASVVKPDPLEQLLQSREKLFVNVVNSGLCFQCFPVFMMTAEYLQHIVPPENLVYVFPSMRSILQEKFLKENLNISPQTTKTIFNDELYRKLQEQYALKGTSNILYFENQQLKGMVAYHRTNVEEIIQFVKGI